MTTVSDITNRLAADTRVNKGAFYTAVFDYGAGIIEVVKDGGYQAGTAAKIELEADLSAAEVYIEGQNLPAPVESTWIVPSFAFKHIRSICRMSGHERRALGSAEQGAANPSRVEMKVERAMFAIRDLMAQTFDDAASYGLEGIIDATSDFGDTSRATYTKLASYELSAAGAAISTALLNKLYTLSQDTPYGAQPDLCLVSATQAHKWAELVSGKLALPEAKNAPSGSLVPSGLYLGTAPVMILPNLTNSVVLALTGVQKGDWQFIWNEENPGRFHILDLGAANADTPLNLQISTSGALVCVSPQRQAKLTTLTTA